MDWREDEAVDEDMERMRNLARDIKLKLSTNKNLKLDGASRYPEIDKMTLKELEDAHFNLCQDEMVHHGGGVSTFMLHSMGKVLSSQLNLPGLEERLAGDAELRDNISAELGKWAFIPNPFIIVMRIGNHIYEEFETEKRRRRASPQGESVEQNKT